MNILIKVIFFFFLTICLTFLLFSFSAFGQDNSNQISTETLGGTVALSTAANQIVEFGKRKLNLSNKEREEDTNDENSLIAMRIKQRDLVTRVISLERKLKGVEVFLTRTQSDFDPKDTEHGD